jgi:hypothetical protein
MGKLGQLLVARGWINLQQLTRALQNQSVTGGRLGTCLLELDALGEAALQRGLSEQFGVPATEIDDLRGIPEEVLALVPKKLARRCRAVPFRVEGGRLDLAVMDPRNLSCQDEIAFATGKRVKVYVLQEIRFLEALERYYGEECPSRYGLLLDRLNRTRYLWQPAAPPRPEPALNRGSTMDNRLASPPKLSLPPPLPEIASAPPAPIARAAPPNMPSAAAPPIAAPPPPNIDDTQPVPSPPPPPSRPPRPLRVSLTDEERSELERSRASGGRTKAMPREAAASSQASAAALSPQNEAEALAALAAADDLETVGEVLLSFLALRFRRVALFRVTRERVQGWMIRGTSIDQQAFHDFSLTFDQPSLFLNLRQGSGLHLGPLPPMPAHRQLARVWGGELPRDAVMLPIRMRDRLVTVLYADGPPRGTSGVDLPQLQRLGAALMAAFERCAVAKRPHPNPA